MAKYILSQKADEDLEGIYIYSHESFGEKQAIAYFLSLRDCLNNLANSPHIGRDVSFLHPGMYCHNHKRHMVYYLIEGDGVFVVRVLHDAMDAHLHL